MNDFTELLNHSNLASGLSQLKAALIFQILSAMKGSVIEKPPLKDLDLQLLNNVGPAAACSAVEYTINHLRTQGKLQAVNLNGSMVHNVQAVQNNTGLEEYTSFSSTLRQFLLPRYAYLDFDQVIDPRHLIDLECGYPKWITPIMYRYMYDRDDVARRVVDIYPDESWAAEPEVYETDDETENTEFEIAWEKLCYEHNIMQYLYRIDKLCGIGHYGVLLLQVNDGEDLEQPINEAALLGGQRNSVSSQPRELLWLRPFDEYLSFIHQYQTDTTHPRYGLPEYYNLVFLDMTIDSAGASIGTRLNRRVHWSRVVHIADNLGTSQVFATPRQQPVFNRLLDLRKIKGGSGEMFWKGAFPGISFEINPDFVADNPEFDKDKFDEEIRRYSDGLQRYLRLVGISAKSLAPQVSDPDKHVKVQMEAISAHYGIPIRIFLGSEEGRLASSQDKNTWNMRLGRRNRLFVEPSLVRKVIDRFIAVGILPPPKSGRYYVGWGDLNAMTDEDKANLSLKWTQALSQYVSSGVIHLISPVDYMTLILGLRPRDALRLDQYIKASGGYEKLRKVDPSQGSGVNGKRENNVSKEEGSTSKGERDSERNTADKKTEGSSS